MMNSQDVKNAISGVLVVDKPVGMTSTHAVSRLKRIYNAKKAGHAGTLDPLASGLLPVAFGEATKTVPFVQDGEKAYRFTVAWGGKTDTDDAEGRITRESDERPTRAAIEALLPRFIGDIQQTPPQYSAIKIAGERAYDLAREGEQVELGVKYQPPGTRDQYSIALFDITQENVATKLPNETFHRATGSGLATVGSLLLVWWLAAIAAGDQAYATFRDVFTTSTGALNPIGWVVGLALTWAVFQHMASGIRHLFLDAGAAYELKVNKSWSVATFVCSALLTGFFWLFIFGKAL